MLRTDLIDTVPQLLSRQAARLGNKTAFEDAGGRLSYADLDATTACLAGHLQRLGLERSQTAALMLPNGIAWVQACLSIVRAGAAAVPISHDATQGEVAYRLADADCRTLFVTRERAALAKAAMAEIGRDIPLVIVERGEGVATGEAFAALLASDPGEAPRDDLSIEAPAFVVYTSGTTGRAKGVLLSQHSMLWVNAACWAPIAGLGEDDFVYSPLPLFHSYALNLSVLSIVASGASEFIAERFSTSETVKALRSGRFTMLPGVPTMFHYLLQDSAVGGGERFPGLRLCVSAGAIMPAKLNTEFEGRFGVPLLDGYGITETSTMVTMNWSTGARVMGSCGLPLPAVATRIVDPVTGADVERGGEGELIVRGPNVMLGYLNKPAETAAALRDGWYRTGDLARSDRDGFLTITGRLKELIIRGGQNIAPAEVEEAILTFEGVSDCAVVGMPHPHLGEEPVVFVVPAPGGVVAESDVIEHCRTKLSSYKVPKAVHLVAEIPRTGSGKIMRFRLRETLSTPA